MPNPFAQAALANLTAHQRQQIRDATQKRLEGYKALQGMQGATGVQAALFRPFSPTLNDAARNSTAGDRRVQVDFWCDKPDVLRIKSSATSLVHPDRTSALSHQPYSRSGNRTIPLVSVGTR